ncbi:MAG: threonine ammonia-lyase, biosynthetic [Gammaproteobacteria bacterium]|nr:threonine ammonia-lyase, biosynthetic [Gammaproteobacteria bacterium]
MSAGINQHIDNARVYELAQRTPLEHARILSAQLHNDIYLKREDLQSIFSFKIRGAYNKIAHLVATENPAGVVCASAGNHAQGVSLAAKKLDIHAIIVMPITTPAIKIEAVRALDGEVIIHGDTFDDASDFAKELAQQKHYAFIHPFDDPLVIAGQGTVAREILAQSATPVDIIFVPVGGGGLAAGMAACIKHHSPTTRVIGVEPEDAASMSLALQTGAPATLDRVGAFADGVAVKRVGDHTFALCQQYLDDVICVSTDEMCAAIKDVFLETRVIAEPAGAISIAGLRKYVEEHKLTDQHLVAINSGANMNFDRLLHVTERANIGAHEEALLAVEIPEQTGSFLAFCKAIGRRPVTEFNYRYDHTKNAHIFVGIKISHGTRETLEIIETLRAASYKVVDLTHNTVAKLHLRHLAGGSVAGLENERLYRFQFPERPGALLDFLAAVGITWNISLFHYRNHGSDFGRVLCGIQVPDAEFTEFQSHIDELGYAWWDESDNPVYRLFLEH